MINATLSLLDFEQPVQSLLVKPGMRYWWSWVSQHVSTNWVGVVSVYIQNLSQNKTLLTFEPVWMVTSYSGTQLQSTSLVSASLRTLW